MESKSLMRSAFFIDWMHAKNTSIKKQPLVKSLSFLIHKKDYITTPNQNFMKLKKLLFFSLLALAFTGCQKEPDFPEVKQEDTNACSPVKVYSFEDNGNILDSAIYQYTNDKLTKSTIDEDTYVTYEYTGDNVTKRSFFEIGIPQPFGYQVFSYNQDSTLAKIETHDFDNFFGDKKADSTLFTYTNSKLTNIKSYTPLSSSDFTLKLDEEYQLLYTGNNVTKMVVRQYTDGVFDQEYTYLFTYDSKPNYLKKQAARFLQTDPIFIEADYSYYVFALTENNIIKVQDEQSPSDATTYSYTADAKGNLSEMKADGSAMLRYFYECK